MSARTESFIRARQAHRARQRAVRDERAPIDAMSIETYIAMCAFFKNSTPAGDIFVRTRNGAPNPGFETTEPRERTFHIAP